MWPNSRCGVSGAEPVLAASPNLHYAAPGKNFLSTFIKRKKCGICSKCFYETVEMSPSERVSGGRGSDKISFIYHLLWPSLRLLPQDKSLKHICWLKEICWIPFSFSLKILLFSSRAQWYRPLWTLLCHYSRLLWWPHLPSRWVTSLLAAQERWDNVNPH